MINAVIIGTGFSAKHHYNALRDRENVRIVGIWNRRHKIINWAGDPVFYIGHGEPLTALLEKADLIILAIPAGVQYQFAIHSAVHAGTTLILEKPFGTESLPYSQYMRSALKLGKSYMPFVWRYNRDIQALFNLAGECNPIGRVHSARFFEYVPTPFVMVENWATMADQGGGLLANIGTHQVDLLFHFLPMNHILHGGTTLTYLKEDGYRITKGGFPLGFIDSLKYRPGKDDSGIRVTLTGDIGYSAVLQGHSDIHGDISVTLQAGYGNTTPSKGIELHGEYGSATWHEHGTALHKDNRVIPIDRGPPPDLQTMYNLFYDALLSDDQQAPTLMEAVGVAITIKKIRKSWVYKDHAKQV